MNDRRSAVCTAARLRVLIVDDDRETRHSLAEVLQLEGFDVETAEHGRAALQLLHARGLPALIVLDLAMPVMDGQQFLDKLWREPRWAAQRPSVVVISALDEARELQACYGCEVFRKPVEIGRVVEIARTCCAMS